MIKKPKYIFYIKVITSQICIDYHYYYKEYSRFMRCGILFCRFKDNLLLKIRTGVPEIKCPINFL